MWLRDGRRLQDHRIPVAEVLAEQAAGRCGSEEISWPEEYEEHRAELDACPARFTTITRSRLEDGKNVSAADYIWALKQQAALTAEVKEMREVDILVLLTTKKPAQVLGYEHTELGNIAAPPMPPARSLPSRPGSGSESSPRVPSSAASPERVRMSARTASTTSRLPASS